MYVLPVVIYAVSAYTFVICKIKATNLLTYLLTYLPYLLSIFINYSTRIIKPRSVATVVLCVFS